MAAKTAREDFCEGSGMRFQGGSGAGTSRMLGSEVYIKGHLVPYVLGRPFLIWNGTVSVNFISLVNSCLWLREEDAVFHPPQNLRNPLINGLIDWLVEFNVPWARLRLWETHVKDMGWAVCSSSINDLKKLKRGSRSNTIFINICSKPRICSIKVSVY